MNFDWYSLDAIALIPLGLIGFIRWGMWSVRKLIGFTYKAQPARGYSVPVSIVTPVYKETPAAFEAAVDSWLANKPQEIIAVIDIVDEACAEIFKRKAAETVGVDMKLIMTDVPGKRPALALGIRSASCDIVALIDSDTLWEPDAMPKLIAPFENPKVAGVTCRQAVDNPRTLGEKLSSLIFELRYADELPFLAVGDQGFSCLSGRTAVYRRPVLLPLLDQMVHETFWGRPCISGEDKRLTYLVQAAGHKTRYQDSVTVTTFAPPKLSTLLKQKVRWTRNSWRADLRALTQRWVWKRPVLAFYLVDKCVSAVTTLIAPLFLAVALYLGEYSLAGLIVIWWLISRFLKAAPYLQKYPKDIWIVPVFVIFGFVQAVLRIFALATMNRQGWMTRGHATAPQQRLSRAAVTAGAYLATGSVMALVVLTVVGYRQLAVP